MPVRSLYRSFPANLTTNSKSVRPAFLAAAAVVACAAPGAMAQLTLTPEGVSRGYSLTVFASGFPSASNIGPLGIDFPNDGGVLVTTFTGNVQRFARGVDNQLAGSVPIINNYGMENAIAIAHVGDRMFMTQRSPNRVVELNPGYASIARTVVTTPAIATSIVANPANGHLFVSTVGGNTILDIDPVNSTSRTLVNVVADGLSINEAGTILYAAVNNRIIGYDTTSGVQVFSSNVITGGVDGTALGYGQRAGLIYANSNDGRVWEVNLTTLEQTVIASMGSRGDFVTADPLRNGDLYLTQTSTIVRLSGIPAPSTAALLGLGGLLAARRRR
jgi:hypothetical protein